MDHLTPQITVERTPGPGMLFEHLTPQHLDLKDALRDATGIYIAPRAGRAKKARTGVTLVPDKYRNRHQPLPDRTHYELVVNYQDARVNELVIAEFTRVLYELGTASHIEVRVGHSLAEPDYVRFTVPTP